MGLTIYQSITPAGKPEDNSSSRSSLLCRANDHPYRLRTWLGVRRSTCLLSLYILAYFAFLIGGSFLFCYLEQENEIAIRNEIRGKKEDFILRHPDVTPGELEKLLKDISIHGISALEKDEERSNIDSNWSFGQSFLFTVTIVTTVGYGHINPITPIGKLVCIIYCCIGIPFTLVFLSAIVQRLLPPTFSLLSKLMNKLTHLELLEVRLMHLIIMALILAIFAFILPSVIFWFLEPKWSFLDSLYFVFISLTTIGLGDYIPGDTEDHTHYRNVYKTGVGVYLLTGLVLLSLTLTVYYDIPQLNLGLALHRHRDICELNPAGEGIINKECEQTSSQIIPDEDGELNHLVTK